MIRVENLQFQYPSNDHLTLKGLSFEVEAGEIFGFLGPSGAGKSTTQNILVRLLRAWIGRVEVMGKNLETWGQEYYDQVGVSFELPNHYSKLTARENLEYFRCLYQVETLSPEQVTEWVGLKDDLDRSVADYSKGMKNRLNLARSLLHSPRLWFIDEPTSGLDPVSAQNVRELVKERQSQGVTTILTTHDMVTAESICDRVAFIVDGEIAEIGTPAELERRYGRKEVEVIYGDPKAPCKKSFAFEELKHNPEFTDILALDALISIHSQECSLAEVFVQVTGRRLA